MSKYAQILDNIIVNIVELNDEIYEITRNTEHVGNLVNISAEIPLPDRDWSYDDMNGTFTPPDLIILRNEKKSEIDGVASVKRQEAGGNLRGQSEIYIAKNNEANLYIKNEYPDDLVDYPWIEIEVEASGLTPILIADTIITKHADWIKKRQLVELEKRKAKINIDNAKDYFTIIAAHETAINAINGIEF